MECEIMGAVVSQTRVKSLGTTNDIQPQKHVTSWTRYHCQVRCFNRGIITCSVHATTIIIYWCFWPNLCLFFFFFLGGSWEEMDWNRITEAVWLYDTVIITDTLKRTSSLWFNIFAKILQMTRKDNEKWTKTRAMRDFLLISGVKFI